ncbi:MAG: hypothetical protein V4805_10720 [Pseudomonadota bacterium]
MIMPAISNSAASRFERAAAVCHALRVARIGQRNAPYRDANDLFLHWRLMDLIANEMGRTLQEVVPLYETILKQSLVNASVREYLPILVSKNVRQILGR